MTTPLKYYFSDVGLRNARLGFRQLEENHIMENIIYCDLIRRGYDVDVGIVEYNIKTAEGKKVRKQLEVDFVVNRIDQRFYIQSTFSVADPDKRKQELNSLMRIPDFSKELLLFVIIFNLGETTLAFYILELNNSCLLKIFPLYNHSL